MSDLAFLDTNLLIYAHDSTAGKKRQISADLIASLWDNERGCISTQVLAEFYSAATRKLAMPAPAAEQVLKDLGAWTIHRPNLDDLLAASRLHRKHAVPWWDGLILQSALSLGCSVLWTEDFSHGQRFGNLAIRNPFL